MIYIHVQEKIIGTLKCTMKPPITNSVKLVW